MKQLVLGVVSLVMLSAQAHAQSSQVQRLQEVVQRLGVATDAVVAHVGDLRAKVATLTAEQSSLTASAFGAKCDGATDDTAALRALFAAADTAPYRNVLLPAGTCRFMDTLTIGGHPDRYAQISVAGQSEYTSTLRYAGPMDRPAILISHVSAFSWSAVAVNSGRLTDFSQHGTGVGIQIDGPNNSGGTMNSTFSFNHVLVAGFSTGMLWGLGDSASEGECRQCTFQYNDVGWTASNYNSMNFWFYGVNLLNNTYGMKFGGPWVTDGPHVVGGSTAGNKVADFYSGNVFGLVSIENVRAELTAPAKFFTGTSAPNHLALRNNIIESTNPASVLVDVLGPSDLTGNVIRGKVALAPNLWGAVLLRNNRVREGTAGFPAVLPVGSLAAASVEFIGNVDDDATTKHTLYFPDYRGRLTNMATAFEVSPGDLKDSPAGGTHLTSVRSLARGAPVPGRNLWDTATFTGSGAVAVRFTRTVVVTTTAGSSVLSFAAGAIRAADVGKAIRVAGATKACGGGQPTADSVDGRIAAMADSTHAQIAVMPWQWWSDRCRQIVTEAGSRDAVIGEDEPDAAYFPLVSCNTTDAVGWSDLTPQGFTLTSSNPTSTATCNVLILR